MSKPVVADNKPAKVNLEEGSEYYFCTCGRSSNQPFCDGSHAGSEFKPQAFTAEKSGDAYLCACKHSNNYPFCDGTHKKFNQNDVGKPGPGVAPETGSQPKAVATEQEPTVFYPPVGARRFVKNGPSWANDVYGDTKK